MIAKYRKSDTSDEYIVIRAFIALGVGRKLTKSLKRKTQLRGPIKLVNINTGRLAAKFTKGFNGVNHIVGVRTAPRRANTLR